MNNDLISREALKKAAKELYKETPDGIVRFGIENVFELINNAPTVAERPQGKWLDEGEQFADYRCEHSYMCSNCGWHTIEIPELLSGHRFCKHCGAEMKDNAE